MTQRLISSLMCTDMLNYIYNLKESPLNQTVCVFYPLKFKLMC